MFPTSAMCAINESPVGALPLHFRPFPVRSISSSEMASEQKARREGSRGSCALRPLVLLSTGYLLNFSWLYVIVQLVACWLLQLLVAGSVRHLSLFSRLLAAVSAGYLSLIVGYLLLFRLAACCCLACYLLLFQSTMSLLLVAVSPGYLPLFQSDTCRYFSRLLVAVSVGYLSPFQLIIFLFAVSAGYVYVLFETDKSVKALLQACTHDFSNGGEYYFKISSRRMRSKEARNVCRACFLFTPKSFMLIRCMYRTPDLSRLHVRIINFIRMINNYKMYVVPLTLLMC